MSAHAEDKTLRGQFKRGSFEKVRIGASGNIERYSDAGYLHKSGLFGIDRSWNTTHIPTGLRCNHGYIFNTLRQAKKYIGLLLPICDWTTDNQVAIADHKEEIFAAEQMALSAS